jgi:hypothetical protein
MDIAVFDILIVRTDNATVAGIVQPHQEEGAMKRKQHLATSVGLAVGLAFVALVPTAAAAGGPQPVAPAQAQALIGAPAVVSSGSVTRTVSAREALASASAPGAVVSVAPGLSPGQAVGLSPAVSSSAASASIGASIGASPVVGPIGTTTAGIGCSANAQWYEWGTWPYQQRITDTTYWCAVWGDHITYTSSSTSGSGTICDTSWTSSQMISGGIGYSWFVTRASAGFNCQTAVPWLSLHPSHYLDTSRNAWGSTQLIGAN